MKKYWLLFIIIVAAVVVGLFIFKEIERSLAQHELQSQWEANATGSLRVLNTALATYTSRHGNLPLSLKELGPRGDDLVSADLSEGRIPGYEIEYKRGPGTQYELRAYSADKTWNNYFTDQTYIIREGLDASGPSH
jgi:hypothetical protein